MEVYTCILLQRLTLYYLMYNIHPFKTAVLSKKQSTFRFFKVHLNYVSTEFLWEKGYMYLLEGKFPKLSIPSKTNDSCGSSL